MDPKRVLVVYYSRTGTTRHVARAIREELGPECDIERILEGRNRRGALGYLGSMVDSVLQRPAALRAFDKDPGEYDLVIVGTPVWNASVSTPVRTYLTTYRDRIRRLAVFCTYGGTGSARALRQMAEVAGQAPVVTLAVRMGDVKLTTLSTKVRTFVAALRGERPGRPVMTPALRPQGANA